MASPTLRMVLGRALAATALVSATLAAQTVATVSGGRLSLTTSGGDQSVKVEVRNGNAFVFGFPGIPDGTTYSGLSGMSVSTGAGNDKVEVDIDSPASFDVRVDTGAGPSERTIKWRIGGGGSMPAASIVLESDTAIDQIVNIEVESASQNASVAVQGGTVSEIAAKVNSSNVSEFLGVTFGATAPKVSLEVASQASALELNLAGGPSGAADELVYKVAQSRPADVSVTWNLDTGAGADKVEASIVAPGGTILHRGSILTRNGDDLVKIDSEGFGTATGLTINGGPGNDELSQIIKGRFLASQTLRSRMLGADGSDALRLTTDTGIFGTGLPGDLFPLVDCGAGIDGFDAFGQIRGCETRF